MKVQFDNRQEQFLDDEIKLLMIDAIQKTLEEEKSSLDQEISVSFVNNKEIKEINKEFRSIDSETDVLSFPTEFEFDIEGIIPLGDIIISVEKAKEQAENFGHSLKREMVYLTIHSTLHLLGYDHINEKDKLIMREKEKIIVRNIGVYKNMG